MSDECQEPEDGTIAAMVAPDPTHPRIEFTERRLANGLRVIVAPDHLVPVVAVNLWYDVGSKHEAPGRTGFAHLFEHFMFQGSAHVAKAEHMSIVQGSGGVCNATTWFDRTNYFETLPSNQLELGLWLEADRLATLLDALSQENLDNQREVVKNEKRQSYDNRPYGSFYEKLMAAVFPPGHPYHHTPIGSMADLDAASLEDVTAFFRTYYAPDNAVLTIVGDVEAEVAFEAVERWFGPIPASGAVPRFVAPATPPHIGRSTREIGAGQRAAGAGPLRVAQPCRSARPPSMPSRWPPRSWPAGRAAACTATSSASGRSPRTCRCSRCRWSPAEPCVAGWATVRPEADPAEVEAAFLAEMEQVTREPVTADELLRAHALIESS